jgi:hypothetical protein
MKNATFDFYLCGSFLYKEDEISTSLCREHYFIENKKCFMIIKTLCKEMLHRDLVI